MKDDHLRRGIDEFNREYFFECHDTLEELWMDTIGHDRLFLQGLIQVSVGFYHLSNKNYRGAFSQFTKGLKKLDGYRPVHKGIELEEFMKHVQEWRTMVERTLGGDRISFDETKVPKLQFLDSIQESR